MYAVAWIEILCEVFELIFTKSNMKILITGIHGFVGGNIVKPWDGIMKFMVSTLLLRKKRV